MMCALKKTVLWLEQGQMDRLREIKKHAGTPISFLIRKAIDEFLARHVQNANSTRGDDDEA